MESDIEHSLLSAPPRRPWYRRLLCCYTPAEEPRVNTSQLSDLPSPALPLGERKPVHCPVLDYAAERVYLIGKGTDKVFAMIHHVNLTEDPGHLTDARPGNSECVPRKLWKRRLELFSKFDEGVKVDLNNWTECILERVAKVIAKRCKNGKVFDAFCGTGSNAIQFARHCQVIALDIDPLKIEYARHNATLYEVNGKVSFFQGDFMLLADQIKADVVFIDPPKCGIVDTENCSLQEIYSEPPLVDILRKAERCAKTVLLYLPKETNLDEVAWLIKAQSEYECAMELDVFHLRGAVLGICVVMGAGVSLPQRDVLRLTASRLCIKDAEELKMLESVISVGGLRKTVDLLGSLDALSSATSSRIGDDRTSSSKAPGFFSLARDDPDFEWDKVMQKTAGTQEGEQELPTKEEHKSAIIRLHTADGGDPMSEILRMLLVYKGHDFIDHRVSVSKYDPARLSELSEFGLFPVCEIEGRKLMQTKPIARFLAHLFELYPQDKAQVYLVESLCDYVVDAHREIEDSEDRRETVSLVVQRLVRRLAVMSALKLSLHDFYVVWLLWRWKPELPRELPFPLPRVWSRLTTTRLSAYSK